MIFFEVRHQGELVELDAKGPCSGLWLVLKPRFRTEAQPHNSLISVVFCHSAAPHHL